MRSAKPVKTTASAPAMAAKTRLASSWSWRAPGAGGRPASARGSDTRSRQESAQASAQTVAESFDWAGWDGELPYSATPAEAVIGAGAWEFLPAEYHMPVAIAGFEPLDILRAVADLVDMLEDGQPAVSNTYARSVTPQGNPAAQEVMDRVFRVSDAEWRGLGAE